MADVPSYTASCFFYIFLTVIFIILFHPNEVMAGSTAAELSLVYGDVTVKKLGAEKATPSDKGDILYVGDTLTTGIGSRVQLVFSDGSFINVSENTAIRVNLYLNNLTEGRRKSVARLLKGKARFLIPAAMSRGSFCIVETDTSRITSTYGDFLVSASPEKTVVLSLDGNPEVRNLSFMAVGTVSLARNRMTTVEKDAPPSRPDFVSVRQRRELIREMGDF